jgi:DNA polymerase-3 subunit alpha
MGKRMSKFAHLHLHTEFSTLDGINRVETLPDYIKSIDQTACAITDHGNISGSYKFYKSCRKAGIKPIIGLEAYYTVGDRSVRERDELNKAYYHMVLLAGNNKGLHNLMKLSSYSSTSGMYYKPRIDDALLAEYSEGIIATSACLGSRSSQLILNGEKKAAGKLLDHHAAIFKDRFFIEVQLHKAKEQQAVNKVLLQIAKERSWPLLLTNDCHYTHESDKLLHEQTLCMQTGSVMSDPPFNHEIKKTGASQGKTRFSFGDIDVHVAHHDWMWERAQAQGIPYEAISNTQYVANSINSDSYFSCTKNRYPKYRGLPEGMPSWTALERLCKERLIKKMGGMPPQVYQDRINYELKVIKKMGFYDYLLIVWEFLNGARDEGVWIGPGRGSAAGSLIAYSLDITQVDPIKYGLVFERWLNYGRAAVPMHFDHDMLAQVKQMVPSEKKEPCSDPTHSHDHSHKEHDHKHETMVTAPAVKKTARRSESNLYKGSSKLVEDIFNY